MQKRAALKVLSGKCSASAKDTTGTVESIRNLRLVRDSAIKARSEACVQLRDVLLTAPGELRVRLDARTLEGKASSARSLRPDLTRIHEPEQAVKYAFASSAAASTSSPPKSTTSTNTCSSWSVQSRRTPSRSHKSARISAGESFHRFGTRRDLPASAVGHQFRSCPGNHTERDSTGEATAKPTGSSTS